MTRSFIARRACAALLAGLTVLLSGCLGGGGNSGGNAQLRVLNLTDDLASIDVSLSGTKSFPAATKQTLTASSAFTAQSYTVSVASAGSPTSLFSGTYSLAKDLHYTGVVWGSADSLNFATLPEDQNDSLAAGTAEVRVYNATAAAGAFDVYLTPVLQDVPNLNGVAATRSSVASRGLSGYSSPLTAGSYRLRITAASNPDDVRLDVPSVTLTELQYATIIITAGQGNALVNATVLVQQGAALTPFNNGNARVRVVASVEINGDNVTRSLIGVQFADEANPLPSGTLRSPSVGPYTSVVSGNRTANITLNGSLIVAKALSIAAGADYTLMAYGSQANPQVVLIPDDNSVPAVGKVQLRLINGDSSVGPVSLQVDSGSLYVPDIDAGTASSYNLYTATTGTTSQIPSRLEVFPAITPDVALYLNPSQTLLSQGVYTVFLLQGSPSGSTGVLRKDR